MSIPRWRPIRRILESGAAQPGRLKPSGLGAADWLSLAAAPTFAVMALLTAVLEGGPLDVLCSAGSNVLTGMAPMYVLMSAFHAAPWVRLMWRSASA